MSTSKQLIYTDNAPKPFGTYSQAIVAPLDGLTVYIAGQIPYNSSTKTLVKSSALDQAEQMIMNVQAICQASGGSLHDIVKVTVFLTDFKKYIDAVGEATSKFFRQPHPARSTVEVKKLGGGANMEMEAIMVIPRERLNRLKEYIVN